MGANMSPGEPACPLIHPVQKTGTTSEQTELLNSLSSALKKRMQGKSCFNFKKRDDTLFDELKKIVRQVS